MATKVAHLRDPRDPDDAPRARGRGERLMPGAGQTAGAPVGGGTAEIQPFIIAREPLA